MNSRRVGALAAALLALAVAGCGSDEGDGDSSGARERPAPREPQPPPAGSHTGSASAPAEAEVTIREFKYAPESVRIAPGGTVTWRNRDRAPHTATTGGEGEAPEKFDTGTLRRGGRGKVTLKRPGTYTYVCSFHAFMTGKVEVRG